MSETLLSGTGVETFYGKIQALKGIDFEVRKGEIVGLGGLVGAGRTDVARALFGVAPAASGTLWVDGKTVSIKDPSEAIALGLAFVPEDRAVAGIFRTLSVEENITAAVPKQIAPSGFIRRAIERAMANDSVRRLSIRLASLRQPIGELSGGNQQKVTIARWVAADARTLLCFDPTRGIDVGTKQEIYRLMRDLAAQGKSVLFYTSELEEIQFACDRVIVIFGGKVVDVMPVEIADEAALTRAAYGLPRDHAGDVGVLAGANAGAAP